ncbi:flagellar FlbD family protein [Peribacillus sp. SCS-26]|uniref:flagellar FlbD family protein n=1 Tax=Paraperibacillus marinus TaxID=3115295 RepID=UPI003905F64A
MIEVTKLNGKKFHINAVFIETVESNPDTTISLSNGKKFIVSESEKEIIHSITRFYKTVSVLGLSANPESVMKGGDEN